MGTSIQSRLVALAEPDFAAFTARLNPSVPAETILGVRTPALRALAKELRGSEEAAAFLDELPHAYFEENCLHAFLLEPLRDFDACLAAVERFLPFVDNWAVCDQMNPLAFRKNRTELLEHVRRWLASEETYTVRFGVKLLMNHFLDEMFQPGYLKMVSVIKSKEYYVNMMRAWYFATALVKQWDSTLLFLQERKLDPWTHNKTIQKAVESYRLSPEQKKLLRELRIKRES
jgi:3-methyladenine DNA glycosylase AlkD